MAYEIIFVGLLNFFELEGEAQGRRILIPDGSNPPSGIDPHVASIVVHREHVVDEDTTWESSEGEALSKLGLMEFKMTKKSPEITISGMEPTRESVRGSSTEEPFNDSDFKRQALHLKDLDSEIDIVPEDARTIAQIPIRRGNLTSRQLGEKNNLIAELNVASHRGPVVITSADGTLTLKNGIEFVIANGAPLPSGSHDPARSHFRIYGMLDRRQSDGLLPVSLATDVDAKVTAIKAPKTKSTHPFLEYVSFVTAPDGQCSVTGCCACAENHT